MGEPLWPGAPFTSVLVAEPGGLVEDLELDAPLDPVRFLPLLPMTPNEAAWKRVHGAAGAPGALAAHGTDLRDPLRSVRDRLRPAVAHAPAAAVRVVMHGARSASATSDG